VCARTKEFRSDEASCRSTKLTVPRFSQRLCKTEERLLKNGAGFAMEAETNVCQPERPVKNSFRVSS